jgi:hypothetical protein
MFNDEVTLMFHKNILLILKQPACFASTTESFVHNSPTSMDTIANATAMEQATDGIIRNEMANMQTRRMWAQKQA